MYLRQFFVDGLGHASYLMASEETNEAAVVDPRRDVDVYVAEAVERGFRIKYVLETHNHNDFISGAQQLAGFVNAEHVASAEAGLRFPHHAVRDGDELGLGELRIKVIFTPGHTPEHVCYVVSDTSRAAEPALIFTGGDLLVGAVGRPDLLGKELGEKLAPLLYDSLHGRILRLEDYVEVLPTHGGGSLCGRGIDNKRTSTIGYEARFNKALQIKDRDEFVRFVLSENPGIPAYYRRMRPVNQSGPTPWHLPAAEALSPEDVRHLAGHGALVLDTRPNVAFGGGHIAGALNIGLGPSLAIWVGWLIPNDVPIVLVLERADQWAEVLTALARVGYEEIVGYLQQGMTSWIEAGLPVEHEAQWSIHELRERLGGEGPQVLDVRTDPEWEAGHIEGAAHIALDRLRSCRSGLDRARQTAVVCGSGYRSSIGVSLLRRQGFHNLINILGGMTAWYAAGLPTTREGGRIEQPEAEVDEALRAREEGAKGN